MTSILTKHAQPVTTRNLSHPPPHLSNAGARLCTHGRRIDALAPSLADRAAHGLVITLHRLTCLVVMAMVTARTRACVGCATAVGECTGGREPNQLHRTTHPSTTRHHQLPNVAAKEPHTHTHTHTLYLVVTHSCLSISLSFLIA